MEEVFRTFYYQTSWNRIRTNAHVVDYQYQPFYSHYYTKGHHIRFKIVITDGF